MSSRPTAVSESIWQYLESNWSAEDPFLQQLREDARKEGIPEICISADQARFLQFFLRSIRARFVLEIGTLAGYSAIAMARALPPDGRLLSVEVSRKHADFARARIAAAGLADRAEVLCESGLSFLERMQPKPRYDFIFVDADKQNYQRYLDLATPLLHEGGVFCADNALAFGKIGARLSPSDPDYRSVEAIESFNSALAGHPAYFSALLTCGDGMALGFKLPSVPFRER